MFSKNFQSKTHKFSTITFLCLSFASFAASTGDFKFAPPNFKQGNDNFVFVDIKSAHYKIVADFLQKTIQYESVIEFESKSPGMPILPMPLDSSVWLSSEVGKLIQITPPTGPSAKLTAIRANITPGIYQVKILRLSKMEKPSSLDLGFFMSDLHGPTYLDHYLPSNYLFDQYPADLEFTVVNNGNNEQKFYSNGAITESAFNHVKIQFPSYFNSSSYYFHTAPSGKYHEESFEVFSKLSGKDIPVLVYGDNSTVNFKQFIETIKSTMEEFESTYGPWPHPSLLVHAVGMGGMEHSGAVYSDFGHLKHEILHSYFGRGVLPGTGEAGWIDEAIATWYDRNYPSRSFGFFHGKVLPLIDGRSEYDYSSSERYYQEGNAIISHLDNKLKDKGGIRAFLKYFMSCHNLELIDTELFLSELNKFSGKDFSNLFKTYVRDPK